MSDKLSEKTGISGGLTVIGILGLVCGALGYLALAVDGNFGDFMRGALPGIMVALSTLVLIVRPRG